MEPVGDLHGRRCRLPRAIRIHAAAVTRDDLGGRVGAQPLGETGGAALGQEVDGPARLEVDQDRAVSPAAALRPIIHA